MALNGSDKRLVSGFAVLVLGAGAVCLSQCTSNSSTSQSSAAGAGTTAGAPGSAGSPGAAGAIGTAGTPGSAGAPGTAGASSSAAGAPSSGGTTGTGGAGGAGAGGTSGVAGAGGAPHATLNNFDGSVFYVTHGDGTLHAIQEGTWKEVGVWPNFPILDNVRGVDADAAAGVLYFTHGAAGPNSDGIADKNGYLGAWDLYQNKLIYNKHLTHGVDQPSFGNSLVYVPAGENTNVRTWYYYRASDGALLGNEPGGSNPHDTIYKNGHRYYGGTEDTYLYVVNLPGVTKVGPSPSDTAGVRPFSVNGSETRAYIAWSNYRGFSVGDLTTGKIIKSVNFATAFPGTGGACIIAPSHGVSLSPDNKEVYVMDSCVDMIRAYTATDDPQLIASVPLTHKIHGGTEQACAWDCSKDGWVMHSRDGKYVYIGDSGDVIDTTTHTVTTYLELLANCRHGFLDVIWKNGQILDTSTHVGLGY